MLTKIPSKVFSVVFAVFAMVMAAGYFAQRNWLFFGVFVCVAVVEMAVYERNPHDTMKFSAGWMAFDWVFATLNGLLFLVDLLTKASLVEMLLQGMWALSFVAMALTYMRVHQLDSAKE